MDDITSIKTQIDFSLLDKVEEECYQILYQQRLRYNTRWYSSLLFSRIVPVLRWAGLMFSLFGALLCIFYIFYPSSCPRWLEAELYLVFFTVVGAFFYYLPRFHNKYITWLKNLGSTSCRRLAKRCVVNARKAIPYDAEYLIKGDLITYYRGTDKQWQRTLKGFAIISDHTTLLFRRKTSIQPTMLVLYDSKNEIEDILKNQDIQHQGYCYE